MLGTFAKKMVDNGKTRIICSLEMLMLGIFVENGVVAGALSPMDSKLSLARGWLRISPLQMSSSAAAFGGGSLRSSSQRAQSTSRWFVSEERRIVIYCV